MEKIKKGVFITFEGIDGCGKSTQIKKFTSYLFSLDKHNHIILSRNPYKDTNIRTILREDSDPLSQADKLADLYINDRKKQVEEIIKPNLEKGYFVVSDRFKLSTIAYQAAQGIDMQKLIDRHSGFPIPNITFIIDLPVEEAIKRMKNEEGRKEQKFEASRDFQENVRRNYIKIKDILEEKIIIIDGNKSPDEVFLDIKNNFEKEILEEKKERYKSLSEIPDIIKEKIKNYFSNIDGDVFVIKSLPPEVTGAALARYSRSPTGMKLTIINEFLDEDGDPCQEKGTELIDRVLNAYGDESVGELEDVHIGIENVSMICIKTIEDRRIGGSPLEQSTRYVKYDKKDEKGRWRYLRPKEIMNTPLSYEYERINDEAFNIYSKIIPKLEEYFKKQLLEKDFEIDVNRDGKLIKAKKFDLINEEEERAFNTAYNFTIRCAALDVGRCVLPSSTLSQLGLLGNGRFFTNLITALKSSELIEENDKGKEIESELKKAIPTYIKWNRNDEKRRERERKMRNISKNIFFNLQPEAKSVTLIYKAEYLDELITSILFPYTNISTKQILNEVKKLSYYEKVKILKEYVGNRESRRDRTPRGLEAGYPITFDLVGCFSEYRDLQRHRMLTQQRQLLTSELGFIMPPEIIEIGMEAEVLRVVRDMEMLNKKLKEIGLVVASQYATLFNHRMRFMMGMNLREFQHLSELRTIPQGHFSYRAMVMEMTKELEKREEWTRLANQFVNFSDPGNKIARAKEQSRIAGENLAKGIDGSIDLD